MTVNARTALVVVVGLLTLACSSDSSSKVEPSPFDGDYSCAESLQTCAEKDLQGSIEFQVTAHAPAAGKFDWRGLGTTCTIRHDLVGAEATLAGAQTCKDDAISSIPITTLESRLTFASDASEVFWYAHQIDSDGCDIFHNATCKRLP